MPRDPRVGIGVASIIYKGHGPDEQVLLGYRTGTLGHGTWSMPGGWHDFDEQPVVTAQRETLEEVGLKLPTSRFLLIGAFSHYLPPVDCWCATLYYEARYNERDDGPVVNVEPEKVAQWRWMKVADALCLPMFGGTDKALRRFIATSNLERLLHRQHALREDG